MMDPIQEFIEKSRKAWMVESAAVLREIERVLERTYTEISHLIRMKTVKGKITQRRLRILQREIRLELVKLRPKLSNKIRKLHQISIKAGLTTSVEAGKLTPFAKKAAVTAVVWDSLNTRALEALARFDYGGLPLSKRVWDVTWVAEKAIRNGIETGVLMGKSASSVARDIKKFLVVPRSPRGPNVLDYRPGSGVYRSAYRNAERLARTEMNRAFVEGMYQYSTRKEWIVGYIWRTASGDPCPICLDNDGNYYPKASPPIIPAHPNCMCYPEQRYSESKT